MRLERLYSPPEIGAPGKRRARGRRMDLMVAGSFVLAMLAVVVAVLTLLSPGLFGGYGLRAYFADAEGLNPGMDVMQDGFVIGRVLAVEPVFAGAADRADCPPLPATVQRAPELPCFRARLRILEHWPVPADSTARLVSAGLFKGNVIRIDPGLASAMLGGDDDRIATLPPEPDVVAQALAALEQAQATIDQTIRPTLVQIQQRVQQLLGGGPGRDQGGDTAAGEGADLRQGLAEVFENLKLLSRDIEQSIDPQRIRAILVAVEQLTGNLATVSDSLTDRSADVGDAVQNYSALADDIRRIVNSSEPDIRASLADTQYLLQELAAALTPILANVETASRNLSALTGDLRQDPKSLILSTPPREPSPWFER
ncbi:MlaD family protein [Thiohalocapsa marina]|nr:MlaD family protein [Thiohalocapsa marina]